MAGSAWTKSRRRELLLRLASAAFLIPFAVYVVWAGKGATAAACALIAALLAYEWVRMTNSPLMRQLTFLAIIPAIVAGFFGALIGAGALAVCTLLAWAAHPLRSERARSAFGLFYTAGMPLAMYSLRENALWDGMPAALLLMAIVWASDSGAFFIGRTFGGPPLASVSPSKTWSGAVGGVGFSILVGVMATHFVDGNVVAWAVAGAVISIAAQVGDLFESVLKRRLGVKDASDLLPGHGGVMDRVDGLGVAAAVGVAILLVCAPVIPLLGLAP